MRSVYLGLGHESNKLAPALTFALNTEQTRMAGLERHFAHPIPHHSKLIQKLRNDTSQGSVRIGIDSITRIHSCEGEHSCTLDVGCVMGVLERKQTGWWSGETVKLSTETLVYLGCMGSIKNGSVVQ